MGSGVRQGTAQLQRAYQLCDFGGVFARRPLRPLRQLYSSEIVEVATGKELRSFTGHIGGVASVSFSPRWPFVPSPAATTARSAFGM